MLVLYFILLSTIFPAIHNRCPIDQTRDDRPTLDTYYESPSGHFWIHYDLDGDDAPSLDDSNQNGIPDYVESTAEAADSARFILTQVMSYIEEEDDDNQKYDIYITGLSSSLWGLCQSESGGGSFIKIRNSYEGMSAFCNNETELLWLTVAHEFFHAIQYAYRSNSNDSYFRELTSMWFENIFVPNCYDFLDFVDMNSSSLFNNPEKGFDDNTSGQVGYSLALYAHYLSTIIDSNGSENQMSSSIIREIWEKYNGGGTIFQSLKYVLEEDKYSTGFSESWIDFMSRNMFCSQYDDMNNGVYYHFGQSLVDPPYVEHETLIGNSTINNEIFIKDDRVSINAYQATDQIIVNSEFISSEVLWYGSLLNIGEIVNISNLESYNNLSANESNILFFIFSNESGEGNMNLILNISVEGCVDINAINYNPNAIIDNGSCEFPIYNSLVSLYPNPINISSTDLTIIYDQTSSSIIDMTILDIKGRLVSDKTFSVLPGRQYVSYNTHLDIPSGTYFLKVSSNEDTEVLKFTNIR